MQAASSSTTFQPARVVRVSTYTPLFAAGHPRAGCFLTLGEKSLALAGYLPFESALQHPFTPMHGQRSEVGIGQGQIFQSGCGVRRGGIDALKRRRKLWNVS